MEGFIQHNQPRQAGNGMLRIMVSFTTDGSGVPTLSTTYRGAVTIAKATNTYTITFPGKWALTYGVLLSYTGSDTIGVGITDTPGSATVALAFGAAMNSQRVTFELCYSHNLEG